MEGLSRTPATQGNKLGWGEEGEGKHKGSPGDFRLEWSNMIL